VTGYVVTVEVELEEYFGHWCIHLWTPHHKERINCAADTAGQELLKALSRLAVVDGFALDPDAPQ
jgi:hypothetical protein